MTDTATKPQRPSKATLALVLDHLVHNPVMADAMRAIGHAPNTIFVWARRAKEGDPRFLLRWPDAEGPEIDFAAGIVLARSMQAAVFEATLRRDCTSGTPRVLRTPAGDVVYEMDHRLIAEFEGDADVARRLGYDDPFYLHDQDGSRIPTVVYDQAPGALRQHLARSVLTGYNPSERVAVDNRHSGTLIVRKATNQTPVSMPPYARARMEAEPSPLRADLLRRLADLRTRSGSGGI
jgi:hypothetical protein